MNSVREEFTRPQSQKARNAVKQDPNRLTYHLMPPVGWLNDPNGLCQYNGLYHIFYQYTPGNPTGADHRGWGHYTTKDFIHYQEENDPFVPDTEADGKGSYSGSAFIDDDGKLHFFYTGNNKLAGDYDYINSGRIHWVVHSESPDGFTFGPKEVLLKNKDYPDDLSCHVRDPKIMKRDSQYYMVLGARTKDSHGQAEVFVSKDLHDWKHISTIRPEKDFGYMWECPDLFELDGKTILMTCPQGVAQDGILYENIYQNGWFEVNGSLDHDQTVSNFKEFDNGFDFYAPQSFQDEKGRRILIGWMGIPDADYTNPTVEANWQHALTLPRELHFKKDRIYQFPIEEILHLHGEKLDIDLAADSCLTLPGKAVHLELHPQTDAWTITLRKDCTLSFANGLFTMDLKSSGSGRNSRHIAIAKIESLDVFSDTSSLEIFINHGQHALTTRIYDAPEDLSLCTSAPFKGTLWTINAFEVEEKLEKSDPAIA